MFIVNIYAYIYICFFFLKLFAFKVGGVCVCVLGKYILVIMQLYLVLTKRTTLRIVPKKGACQWNCIGFERLPQKMHKNKSFLSQCKVEHFVVLCFWKTLIWPRLIRLGFSCSSFAS